MLLILDNYDSFTYNLVQYFQILGQDVMVYLNDSLTLSDIDTLAPDYLVISPGPKSPEDAGIALATIQHCYQTLPILGVCLGHQCLAHAFGGNIVPASSVQHGKTSLVTHKQQGLFQQIPTPFSVMRYHSLAVDPPSLPSCFVVDAWCKDTIMAIRHRHWPLYGLQFHPESILTDHGLTLLQHFLDAPNNPLSGK